ncbi:MAG TPA: hypothetical protein VLB80_02675 [Candidatus Babeliales bacterium]|nr:hypothetical protein [Candidatus Babeliales bacterium]
MSNLMRNIVRKGQLSFCVVLLLFFIVSKARVVSQALTTELAKAQQQGAAIIKSENDEYVQSEAHMQLDEVKEKMSKFIMRVPGDINQPENQKTPNEMVTPYLNIVAAALNKEVELKNSHYVFYNGTSNGWRVPQDLYKGLYAHYNPQISVKDFTFVRFSDLPSIKAQDYLREHLVEYAGINDNAQEVRDVLISTNFALFGNVGSPGECTWNYFIEPKSHKWPFPQNYKQVIDSFDVTYNFDELIKETGELSDMLSHASSEQTLLQFCIPQDKVDDVAYLAWILGFPAHPKSMTLMEERMADKPRVGHFTGKAVKSVMKQFKRDENNPIYKELIQAADNGDFGISGFMDVFRNDPFAIKNANELQARLLITKDIVQNPASGVKIFSYFTTPQDIQDAYLKKLDTLVSKIIAQENSKTSAQKTADRAKNEAIFERIKAEAKEEADAQEAEAKKAAKEVKAHEKTALPNH